MEITTEKAWLAHAGDMQQALDFEEGVLLQADAFLPEAARVVKHGGDDSPAYWAWLAQQWDEAEGPEPPDIDDTPLPLPAMLGFFDVLPLSSSRSWALEVSRYGHDPCDYDVVTWHDAGRVAPENAVCRFKVRPHDPDCFVVRRTEPVAEGYRAMMTRELDAARLAYRERYDGRYPEPYTEAVY